MLAQHRTWQHITSLRFASRHMLQPLASRHASLRRYRVHLLRVVTVMALFSLTSITALVEDDDVNATDRLAVGDVLFRFAWKLRCLSAGCEEIE
jgi:hypothetical protein